jgi:DNA-binding transcriptional MerR regulator
MKYLGFSLDDIKTRLPAMNTPEEVSVALTEQVEGIREKIKFLKEMADSIDKLNAEVVQIASVDWKRYADIVILLQSKNNAYWVMKYLSDNSIERIYEYYDFEKGAPMMERYKQLFKKAVKTQKDGHAPESEPGQTLAKEWWDFVTEFSKGDMTLLSELIKMGESINNDEWERKFSFDKGFLEKAMEIYFTNTGHDPYKIMEGNA